MFRNKKKLPSKVKYQSSRFQTKLARARMYQRSSGGWSKWTRYMRALRWSARVWLSIVFGAVAVGVSMYVVWYPNWFFIRDIKIVGARVALEQELHGQVNRYLDQRSYLILHRNILFLSQNDLQSYIAVVNPGVWRVDEIKKQYPRTLVVRVTPRDPAFLVVTRDGSWLISNDGVTLPFTAPPPTVLTVSAVGLKNPELGKNFFTGNLLTTLTAVKKNFATTVGLPAPTQVILKPVLNDTRIVPSLNEVLPTTGASLVPTALIDVPTFTVSELMPEEVEVEVPASSQTSAFRIILQSADSFDEVFRQLQVLIAKQSADRLMHLAYIDMRFAGKAFICLQNTPCARPEGVAAPQPPAVNPPTLK